MKTFLISWITHCAELHRNKFSSRGITNISEDIKLKDKIGEPLRKR